MIKLGRITNDNTSLINRMSLDKAASVFEKLKPFLRMCPTDKFVNPDKFHDSTHYACFDEYWPLRLKYSGDAPICITWNPNRKKTKPIDFETFLKVYDIKITE
jgi:hypothetical protein